MSESNGSPPVLHHLRFSHYNEKGRWALDYKGIPHRREASLPVLHAIKARRLARKDRTFPILVLDGEVIQGSDRIIDTLERIKPDPPLYPADSAERERALELQRYLDDELGPHVRRLFFYYELQDPDKAARLMSQGFSERQRRRFRRGFPLIRRVMRTAMRIDAEGAEISRRKMMDALDRLDAELGSKEYLAGGAFSAADLAGAALLFPLVRPSVGMQMEVPERWSPPLEELRDSVADRPFFGWVEEMYRRHRGASAELPA
jgi:glutathione S-transferase